MAEAAWYYGVGGQQHGPVSRQQLLAMIAGGQIGPNDLVWRDGMAAWAALSTVAELAQPAAAAPGVWYYGVGGQQHGPVSQQQLLAIIAAGQLGPKDFVWREGMAAWAAVSTVAELAQPAGAAATAWHYSLGGQQLGPVSLGQLLDMIAAGRIGPANMVWREGMPNWARVDTVAELQVPSRAAAQSATLGPTQLQYATPVLSYGVEPEYAGFWLRFVAAIVDGLVTGAIGCVGGGLIGGITGGIMGASGASRSDIELVAQVLAQILSIIIGWLYYALMESSARQATLGKMALHIVVTDVNGNRISFGRASGRYFAKLLSFFTFLIGYIMAGFTERKQALHDMVASTLVIRRY